MQKLRTISLAILVCLFYWTVVEIFESVSGDVLFLQSSLFCISYPPSKDIFSVCCSFHPFHRWFFPWQSFAVDKWCLSRPPQNISLSEYILLSVFSILINLFLDKSCEEEDAAFLCSSAGISAVSHHLQTTCWIGVWDQVVCKQQQLCLV